MKTFTLTRFGVKPDSRVTQALQEVIIRDSKPSLIMPPFCFVSIFESEMSLQEIDSRLKKISNIIYILSEEAILNFGEEAAPRPTEEAAPRPILEILREELQRAIKKERYLLASELNRQIQRLSSENA